MDQFAKFKHANISNFTVLYLIGLARIGHSLLFILDWFCGKYKLWNLKVGKYTFSTKVQKELVI